MWANAAVFSRRISSRWWARVRSMWSRRTSRQGSHERHRRWSADGTWDRILCAVQADADLGGRIDWTMILWNL